MYVTQAPHRGVLPLVCKANCFLGPCKLADQLSAKCKGAPGYCQDLSYPRFALERFQKMPITSTLLDDMILYLSSVSPSIHLALADVLGRFL